MSDEQLDIVDEDGNVVGTMSRSESERLNNIIQNVLVFIFNSKGEVWIQKRAKTKKHFPGLWDISACGAIASGEEPEVAAKRETFEETGIKTELIFVESFLNEFPGHDNQIFTRLSYLYIGISEEKPKINDEVEEFKAVDYKRLATEIKQNPDQYIPSFLMELEKSAVAFEKLSDPG